MCDRHMPVNWPRKTPAECIAVAYVIVLVHAETGPFAGVGVDAVKNDHPVRVAQLLEGIDECLQRTRNQFVIAVEKRRE